MHEAKQERGEDVTILYSENGYTKAKLFAHSFYQKNDIKPPFVEMKDGLRVDFFDNLSNITSTLTAKYGRYFESKGNVLVKDSVVVRNDKGETLHTEELIWNEKMGKFFTDKQVKVNTPTQIIFGDGLEANQDFSVYEIKNVKGTILVDKNRVPTMN
jgi:LPS export ABC transporter protein LptC